MPKKATYALDSTASTSQNYHRLKRECQRKKQLFVDVTFPPTNSSLFLDVNRSSDIVWKRPGELVENPQLFVEGASPNDVTQGILGNCWFVSACSALTHNDELLQKVIPNANAQEWSSSNSYCGIFQFQFWRFGEWFEVIVDDLLPTKDGKLLFARSKTPNEFWSALLEKAFAKLYGCYENLVGGQLADALQDVSGGVAETINVQKFLSSDKDPGIRLFQTLRNAFDQQALIVAAIAAKNKEDVEKSLDCGLVKGHAYAVTAVRYIDLDAKERRASAHIFPTHERQMMIRLQEWNGPWSDDSVEWELVTDAQKKRLGITVDEDGEFWMPWDQFINYFTDISVCQLFNTINILRPSSSTCSKAASCAYNEYIFYDCWTTNGVKSGAPKDRAGGCQNFAATFCFNPQYSFDIKEPNSEEVMVALTQKDSLAEHARQREPFMTIGIHMMRVECNRRYRIHQAVNPVGTSEYASARSVYLHLNDLPVGRYILMPTTYAPREQAEFMLRVYCRQRIKPRMLSRDSPKPSLFQCSNVCSVTRLKLTEASLSVLRDLKVYCCVLSEHEKARTPAVRVSSGKARFNEMFVFHRRSLRQTYVFEIWEDKALKDKKLARCSLNVLTDNDCLSCVLDMQQTSCSSGSNTANGFTSFPKAIVGKLGIEICSYDDVLML